MDGSAGQALASSGAADRRGGAGRRVAWGPGQAASSYERAGQAGTSREVGVCFSCSGIAVAAVGYCGYDVVVSVVARLAGL